MAQNLRKLKRKLAAGDLETDPFSHGHIPECFAADLFDGKSHVTFWGPDAAERCAKWCLKFRGIVYFHNGGNFDFHYLLPFLPLADCQFFMIGKRIVQIKCGGMELRDSYAILPRPLSSLGNKVDIDIQKLAAHRRAGHRSEIVSYLHGDTSALLRAVETFIDKFGLNLTLASTAFKVLREDFNVKIPRTSSSFDRELRKHYFAGRVQYHALGRHVGKFACLDINSAFPDAMTHPHFFSDTYVLGEGFPKKHRLQSFYVVKVSRAGGALAQRGRDNSVTFPKGGGVFHTTGWELQEAIDSGVLRGLEVQLHLRPRKVRDFGVFVRHFFSGKAQAKLNAQAATKAGDLERARFWEAEELHYKLILNSCYGKFGQDPSKYTEVCWTTWRSEDELKGEGWEVVLDDEPRGLTLWERPSPAKPRDGGEFYNVAVAASITGKVRADLFRAIRTARKVLYCDTDSLIGTGIKVPQGDALGEWKLERVFDVFWAGGKKLYIAHDIAYPWKKRKPRWSRKDFVKTRSGKAAPFVHVAGLGWTSRLGFKMASKGVNLPVEDLIAVCEGAQRVSRAAAPTFSLKRGTRFQMRRVNRSDRRPT